MAYKREKVTLVSIIVSISLFLVAFSTLALLGSINVEVHPSTLVIILAIFLGVFFFGLIDIKFALHTNILASITRQLQFMMAPIMITKWSTNIDVHRDGSATLVHEIHSLVHFGINRWMDMKFSSTEPQPSLSQLDLKLLDLVQGREIIPEILLDEEKYKVYRIYFVEPLQRGDRFLHKIQYKLSPTFYFGKKDYYTHTATHYEKEIDIRIQFPEDFVVTHTVTDVITEHGDFWMSHEPSRIVNSHVIEWKIRKAILGNTYRITWETKPRTG